MFRILKISVLIFLPFYSFAQNIDQLIQNSEYETALRCIDSMLLKHESDPSLYLKQGIILEKRFEYSKALKSFEKVYQFDSTNTIIISELAETNNNLGDYHQQLTKYAMERKQKIKK